MRVIQKLTVVSNPTRVFEVGTELNGVAIIEIGDLGREYEDHVHSEYHILDENGELIVAIKNSPVIVEYQEIVEHDPPDAFMDMFDRMTFKEKELAARKMAAVLSQEIFTEHEK